MSLLSRFFGPKYDDQQITIHATNAISADAGIQNPGQVSISSQDGVVTLLGTAFGDQSRYSIEGTVRSGLKAANLKYVRLVNEIRNSQLPMANPDAVSAQ